MKILADAKSRLAAMVLPWCETSQLVRLCVGGMGALVVAYLYVFYASAGRLSSWNSQTNYFNLLAEGFRAGHLHLSVEPSPELLAMADPMDMRNQKLWLWDATLFKGHYYIYWGPVPAILLAIFKTVFRINREIQDSYLVVFFMFARFLVGALFIRAMASEFRVRASSWTTTLAIALWALAHPIPFFLSRGAVYEAAIASGQAFLIAGVYCAFRSLCLSRSPSRRWLILAGVCWGLSVASRLSLAAAIGPLVVLGALASWRLRERTLSSKAGSWVRGFKDLVALGLPVLASLFLLGLYNRARFGSWTDAGLDYQLTTGRFGWKTSYISANLYSYLIRPLKLSCRFPFFDAPADWTSELPPWLKSPWGYSWHESSAGILVVTPWTGLGILAVASLAILLIRPAVRRWAGFLDGHSVNWTVLFCVVAALILATAPAAATLGMWLATMRYQTDFCSGLMFLGTIGCWLWVHRVPWRSLRMIGAAVCALLGTVSIILGLLTGFRGYYNQFERYNPRLYKELARFNFCSAEAGPEEKPVAMVATSPAR